MEENKKNKNYETILLERLEGKIDAIIDGQKITDTKVDLLVEDMDYVKSEIVEIKDRFKETDEALDKKAEKETVDNHENRLIKLENASLVKT
jgi:hypothetical protein